MPSDRRARDALSALHIVLYAYYVRERIPAHLLVTVRFESVFTHSQIDSCFQTVPISTMHLLSIAKE